MFVCLISARYRQPDPVTGYWADQLPIPLPLRGSLPCSENCRLNSWKILYAAVIGDSVSNGVNPPISGCFSECPFNVTSPVDCNPGQSLPAALFHPQGPQPRQRGPRVQVPGVGRENVDFRRDYPIIGSERSRSLLPGPQRNKLRF